MDKTKVKSHFFPPFFSSSTSQFLFQHLISWNNGSPCIHQVFTFQQWPLFLFSLTLSLSRTSISSSSLVCTQRMATAHSVLSGSRRIVHSHSGFASWNTHTHIHTHKNETERTDGKRTYWLLYNVTPDNAVVISMTGK